MLVFLVLLFLFFLLTGSPQVSDIADTADDSGAAPVDLGREIEPPGASA